MSVRDQIVDFIGHWKQRSGLRDNWFCLAFGLSQEKLIAWRKRYGLPNQHNGAVPKDSWLCAKEKQAIFSFFSANRGDGYRRCAYMMIDKNVAYASPSTVYRVLKEAGMLQKKADDTSKGKGFKQPLKPHEHWHTDISYVKIHEVNRKRPVSAIHNIDLDVFLDSHILGILELHPGRETGLLSFFERLKICDVDGWT